MALIPKVSGCTLDCCKYLKVSDVTGQYHVTTNPGGWGAPNIIPAAVTAAELTITYPDATEDTIDNTDLRYTAFLANITGAASYPFELHTFIPTSGTQFPDGVYEIYYSVTSAMITYETTAYILSDCLVSCCVNNMFGQLPNKMCDTCNYTEFLNNAFLAKALLKALRCAASCGDTTKVVAILASLQTICDWADCNCSS